MLIIKKMRGKFFNEYFIYISSSSKTVNVSTYQNYKKKLKN